MFSLLELPWKILKGGSALLILIFLINAVSRNDNGFISNQWHKISSAFFKSAPQEIPKEKGWGEAIYSTCKDGTQYVFKGIVRKGLDVALSWPAIALYGLFGANHFYHR